ncbi:hypothetical protein BU17DRAFT_66135 [Hysterangium stoloniferum]|nr:hypothetical protein BU17DRAFT_66135 [Hysterangium stoloniferum]
MFVSISDAETVVSLLILILVIYHIIRLIFERVNETDGKVNDRDERVNQTDERYLICLIYPLIPLIYPLIPLIYPLIPLIYPLIPLIYLTIRLIYHLIHLTSRCFARTHPFNLTSKEDNAAHDQQDTDGLQKNPLMDKTLPTASIPVTVEHSNPGPRLSLNVAHSAGSEGVAHSVPGYDHTDKGMGSSLQPSLKCPSDWTDKEDNRSYDQQNRDGVEENTFMDKILFIGVF